MRSSSKASLDTVPICPELVRVVKRQRMRNGPSEYVCTRKGKPWKVYQLSRAVSTCMRSLGIDATLHSLRHTYVTALASDPENALTPEGPGALGSA